MQTTFMTKLFRPKCLLVTFLKESIRALTLLSQDYIGLDWMGSVSNTSPKIIKLPQSSLTTEHSPPISRTIAQLKSSWTTSKLSNQDGYILTALYCPTYKGANSHHWGQSLHIPKSTAMSLKSADITTHAKTKIVARAKKTKDVWSSSNAYNPRQSLLSLANSRSSALSGIFSLCLRQTLLRLTRILQQHLAWPPLTALRPESQANAKLGLILRTLTATTTQVLII